MYIVHNAQRIGRQQAAGRPDAQKVCQSRCVCAERNELTRIGQDLAQLGQYRDALDRLQEALAIYREIGLPTSETEESLGNLYLDAGLPDKAVQVAGKIQSPALLGRVHLAGSEWDKARAQYENLLARAEKSQKADDLFTAYTGMGTAWEALKDYSKAQRYYEKAVKLLEEQRSHDSLGSDLQGIQHPLSGNMELEGEVYQLEIQPQELAEFVRHSGGFDLDLASFRETNQRVTHLGGHHPRVLCE